MSENYDKEIIPNIKKRIKRAKDLKMTCLTERRREMIMKTPEYKEVNKWVHENYDVSSNKKEYAKKYYEKNKEKIIKKAIERYKKMPEDVKREMRKNKREYYKIYNLKKKELKKLKGGV